MEGYEWHEKGDRNCIGIGSIKWKIRVLSVLATRIKGNLHKMQGGAIVAKLPPTPNQINSWLYVFMSYKSSGFYVMILFSLLEWLFLYLKKILLKFFKILF